MEPRRGDLPAHVLGHRRQPEASLCDADGGVLADKISAGPYHLDKLEVYRNAYHYWVANDGKMGGLDTESGIEEEGQVLL